MSFTESSFMKNRLVRKLLSDAITEDFYGTGKTTKSPGDCAGEL
jgi:hypothetical protein